MPKVNDGLVGAQGFKDSHNLAKCSRIVWVSSLLIDGLLIELTTKICIYCL